MALHSYQLELCISSENNSENKRYNIFKNEENEERI